MTAALLNSLVLSVAGLASLTCLLLLAVAEQHGHWTIGVAVVDGVPLRTAVGLLDVQMYSGSSNQPLESCSLSELCDRRASEIDTSPAVWCAFQLAGGGSVQLLAFATLLSLAATAVALLQVSERVAPRFASLLQRIGRFGLTTARLEKLVLFLWLLLWLLLVIFIAGYAAKAPRTLGFGEAELGQSYYLAVACVFISSIGGMVLAAQTLKLWESQVLVDFLQDLRGARLVVRCLYGMLFVQLLLYGVVALVRVDMSLLIPCVGVYYLATKKGNVLVAYLMLTISTLPLDVVYLSASFSFAWPTSDTASLGALPGTMPLRVLSSSAYATILLLKGALLIGMALMHTKVRCKLLFRTSPGADDVEAKAMH